MITPPIPRWSPHNTFPIPPVGLLMFGSVVILWGAIELYNEEFTMRGGTVIRRSEKPIRFWCGIVTTFLVGAYLVGDFFYQIW
jgi:hypothetical protein